MRTRRRSILGAMTRRMDRRQALGAFGTVTPGARLELALRRRGAQVTDRDGIANLTTIHPGWYPGTISFDVAAS